MDDSPAVLRAASHLLEGQGIAVVGVATTSEQALSLVEQLEPDVMLVDIDLGPGRPRDEGATSGQYWATARKAEP